MSKNKLILEFTEFNAQRLNPMSSQPSVHVDNPQLSTGAFDKHEDSIRAGISKINDILNNLSNTTQFKSLKSKLALKDQQLTSLKVLRITNSDYVNYDFYISFTIGDQEYFGVVNDLTSKSPQLNSEVFKDYQNLVQSKEWIKRLEGLIIKNLKKCLRPEKGVYELLNDQIYCNSVDTPNRIELKKGDKIEVVSTFENKIIIKYKNDFYNLTNNNFIYFSYWFKKID